MRHVTAVRPVIYGFYKAIAESVFPESVSKDFGEHWVRVRGDPGRELFMRWDFFFIRFGGEVSKENMGSDGVTRLTIIIFVGAGEFELFASLYIGRIFVEVLK